MESRCTRHGYCLPFIVQVLILTFSSDGYEFLMQNCSFHAPAVIMFTDHSLLTDEAGDRICIFGFSRGAYTARGLAGMIHKVRSTWQLYPSP